MTQKGQILDNSALENKWWFCLLTEISQISYIFFLRYIDVISFFILLLCDPKRQNKQTNKKNIAWTDVINFVSKL